MKNYKKGFTLIELLVVIAIIGILSGVVLTSLNSARNKAADAAVKADMANIRAQAEIWYDSNGSHYNTDGTTAVANCTTGVFSDTVIAKAITQIGTQSGATVVCNTDAGGQKWAISVSSLKGDASTATAKGWCVDNSGNAGNGKAAASGACS